MTFVATTASAVEVFVLSPTTVTVNPGESFTIQLGLENASATATNGVVLDLNGLSAAGAVVQSGVAAQQFFAAFCGGGSCFGTINTNNTAFYDSSDLSGGSYTAGDDSVRVISALALSNTTGTGALDPGLNGVPGVHDPLDVSIVLQASNVGSWVLSLSGEYNDGAQMLSFPITSIGDSVTVNVVPEPGTALLMGLGLIGLTAAGRRK